MNPRNTFLRKIIYLAVIATLVIPLHWLSQPATIAGKGDAEGSPGGVLAVLRKKNGLSQAEMGQIDPTGVTMKLATLGLRGVAVDILWQKATDYKMKKDWTNLGATYNQIIKLIPNYINVWANQAWNLSYNVSVEFDDYRQRYRWVIKGIDFLKEGIRYNDRQPRLMWELGWFLSQKIGKADESKQFRRLFKQDDDFHGSRPMALRDNWLVGKEKYDEAVKMVDAGRSMLGKSPLIYRSSGPMCQMSYAEYLEKDGTFGEVAKGAWVGAGQEWFRYGTESIPTTFTDDKTQEPIVIHLGDEEQKQEAIKQLVAQLDALKPGLRKKIAADKLAALSPAQRQALDTPLEKRTGKQYELAAQAEDAIRVTHSEVARQIKDPVKHDQAVKLAKQANDLEQLCTYIHRYREIVNYVYWRLRAQIEQGEDLLTARKLTHQGDQWYAEGSLEAARDAYNQGMKLWRKVLDKNPSLVPDQTAGDDLMDVIKRYRRILNQLDEPFPQPFILQDVIDQNQKRNPSAPPPKEPPKKGGK